MQALKNKPPIRTVIVEDDLVNLRILRELIQADCPGIEVIGEAGNGQEALELLNRLRPQLVFFDVEMPKGNAFEILRQMMPVSFEIIFTTAFSKYALEAFKFSALDYLLKPLDAGELAAAVNRATQTIGEKNINSQLQHLFELLAAEGGKEKRVALPVKSGYEFIAIGEIVCCMAVNRYTQVTTAAGKKYLSPKSLSEYEELTAGYSFFRVHNSTLVNTRYMQKYHKEGRSGGLLEMQGGLKVEVAARRREAFLAYITKG